MKRGLEFFGVLLFLAIPIFAVEPPVEPRALAARVLGEPSAPLTTSSSERNRAQLVSTFKKALDQSSSQEERVMMQAALVHLDDHETIDGLLCGFASSRTASERGEMSEAFKLANAPAVIPRLVDYVYFDDRYEHIERDYLGVGRKDYIASNLVAGLLAKCPDFNARTRASAREISGLTSREIRERIRAWWPANRDAFARMDYKSVKPL